MEISSGRSGAQYLRSMVRPVAGLGVATVAGVGATAAFQVIMSNSLGPAQFGLLSAFLGVINVAAIGSAALRSSVAVRVARGVDDDATRHSYRDPSLVEALSLGALVTFVVLLASPLLATELSAPLLAPVLAAMTMTPYFLFARSLGVLQGVGRPAAVVWWTTGSQILQLTLAVAALIIGLGVAGVLGSYFVTIVFATVLTSRRTSSIRVPRGARPFSRQTLTVMSITVMFAWLTNADLVYVRLAVADVASGEYAAAAVLMKMGLIVPATISLYLLPRLAARGARERFGGWSVLISIFVALAASLVIALALWFFSPYVSSLVFSDAYTNTSEILAIMALTFVPWSVVQVLVTLASARVSFGSVIVLFVAVIAQGLLLVVSLPDIENAVILNGAVGLATALFLAFTIGRRKQNVGQLDEVSGLEPRV